MAHSSESMPENEAYQKGFQELDHMASIVAATLVQLFGDEDIHDHQTAIVGSYSTSINKKKKNAYSDDDVANGIEVSSGERSMKKRRYRSIDNLYMATKPIDFLEGKGVL